MNKCLTCRVLLDEGSECEYCEARLQFTMDHLVNRIVTLEQRIERVESDLDGCF